MKEIESIEEDNLVQLYRFFNEKLSTEQECDNLKELKIKLVNLLVTLNNFLNLYKDRFGDELKLKFLFGLGTCHGREIKVEAVKDFFCVVKPFFKNMYNIYTFEAEKKDPKINHENFNLLLDPFEYDCK
jgi:hypothetical protein